jgi:hypothetical protein
MVINAPTTQLDIARSTQKKIQLVQEPPQWKEDAQVWSCGDDGAARVSLTLQVEAYMVLTKNESIFILGVS